MDVFSDKQIAFPLKAVGDLPDLQDPVAKLCCSWWERQAMGKEQLMAQTLPYILVCCRCYFVFRSNDM